MKSPKGSTNEINARGLRVGLTGGMGCGKSTVAGIFRELGFGVTESDKLVKDLWEGDAEVKTAAVKRWGKSILREDGSVDRSVVAKKVFANAKELEWVEGLLHPLVGARWKGLLEKEPGRDWVVEIPLLFEKGLALDFDFTLCVWASPAQQANRLGARGWAPAEITARQARQWPLREKVERADLVLLNDGSAEFLRHQVEWAAKWLRESPKPKT